MVIEPQGAPSALRRDWVTPQTGPEAPPRLRGEAVFDIKAA